MVRRCMGCGEGFVRDWKSGRRMVHGGASGNGYSIYTSSALVSPFRGLGPGLRMVVMDVVKENPMCKAMDLVLLRRVDRQRVHGGMRRCMAACSSM